MINVCESVLQGLFFDAINHDHFVRDLACVEFETEFLYCGEDGRGGLGWFGVRAGRSNVWTFPNSISRVLEKWPDAARRLADKTDLSVKWTGAVYNRTVIYENATFRGTNHGPVPTPIPQSATVDLWRAAPLSFCAKHRHSLEYNQRQESIREKPFFVLLDGMFCRPDVRSNP